MTTHTQFTARIETRKLNAVKKLAARGSKSTNEQLNEIIELGLIMYATRLRKQKAGVRAPA